MYAIREIGQNIHRGENAISKGFNINERIRAREVRLIDENGEQHGVVPTRDALTIAKDRGLDLIEVAPGATPPVCRIMDYGKYKYEQGKRERVAQKKQKMTEIKTIRMRPKTDEHDFMFKMVNATKFLQSGHKVKFSVIFRSREFTHPEIAKAQLDKMAELIVESGAGKVDKAAAMEGRTMTMILSPTAESSS